MILGTIKILFQFPMPEVPENTDGMGFLFRIMTELIKITEQNGRRLVSARELYDYLDVKQPFATWIKRRIEKYDFIEGEDFLTILEKSNGGRPLKEYALTIDTAKELAMVENNDKGKQARRYFIAVEKKAKEHLKPKTTLEILEMTVKEIRQQSIELEEIRSDIKQIKAQSTSLPEYYTIAGYGSLHSVKITLHMAKSLGQKASKVCRDLGIKTGTVPDPRFGKVKTYPVEVLEEVFEKVTSK